MNYLKNTESISRLKKRMKDKMTRWHYLQAKIKVVDLNPTISTITLNVCGLKIKIKI